MVIEIIKKANQSKKNIFLRKKDKKRRLEFAEMLSQKNISGKNIFFTDEKRLIFESSHK